MRGRGLQLRGHSKSLALVDSLVIQRPYTFGGKTVDVVPMESIACCFYSFSNIHGFGLNRPKRNGGGGTRDLRFMFSVEIVAFVCTDVGVLESTFKSSQTQSRNAVSARGTNAKLLRV